MNGYLRFFTRVLTGVVLMVAGVTVTAPGVSAQTPTGSLTPVLSCITVTANGYVAGFGYTSTYPEPVTIPAGDASNLFTPGARVGQPSTFNPGTHTNVFTVNASLGTTLSWGLRGTNLVWRAVTVTAQSSAPPCPQQIVECTPVSEAVRHLTVQLSASDRWQANVALSAGVRFCEPVRLSLVTYSARPGVTPPAEWQMSEVRSGFVSSERIVMTLEKMSCRHIATVSVGDPVPPAVSGAINWNESLLARGFDGSGDCPDQVQPLRIEARCTTARGTHMFSVINQNRFPVSFEWQQVGRPDVGGRGVATPGTGTTLYLPDSTDNRPTVRVLVDGQEVSRAQPSEECFQNPCLDVNRDGCRVSGQSTVTTVTVPPPGSSSSSVPVRQVSVTSQPPASVTTVPAATTSPPPVTISPPPVSPPVTPAASPVTVRAVEAAAAPSGTLPRTGSDPWRLVVVALTVLAAGCVLLGAARVRAGQR